MWVILGASIIAVAVFLERLFALRAERVVPEVFIETMQRHLEASDIQRAEQLCRENRSPLSHVVESAIQRRHLGRAASKEAMQERGELAVGRLQGGANVLATVAAIAPLLGLLGTVTGMIKVFRDVAGVDNPDIALLARGIWEALITTGFGLTVAIPAFIAYRLIESRIDRFALMLEESSLEALNALFPVVGQSINPDEDEAA